MTAEALKQAALDHLAANPLAAAFSVPLGDGRFVCAGTKEEIAKLVKPERPVGMCFRPEPPCICNGVPVLHANCGHWAAATPPQAKEEE